MQIYKEIKIALNYGNTFQINKSLFSSKKDAVKTVKKNLFIADIFCSSGHGLLHSKQSQDLQQMILHHISDRQTTLYMYPSYMKFHII